VSYLDFAVRAHQRYLSRKWGRRWSSIVATVANALAEAATQAVAARWVAFAPEDALAAHAADRKLERIPGESDVSFRERLRRAFAAYLRGATKAGLQAALTEAGASTAVVLEDSDWAADARAGADWWRFWVIVGLPNGFSMPDLWSDPGTWGDGGLWTDLEPTETVLFLQRLIRKWKAAHSVCASLIVILSGELWDYPDGSWDEAGTWGATVAYLGV
jgi:hypothetical protein